MTDQTCSSCLKPNTTFTCGICDNSICKNCVQFLAEEAFAFLKEKPSFTVKPAFCPTCFTTQVEPELQNYNSLIESARNIYVFFKGQGKEVRGLQIKKSEDLLQVSHCPDYEETVLRLAFQAAQEKYNVIVDVDVFSEKVQNGSFQYLLWHGTAIPGHADQKKLSRTTDPKFTKW